MSKTARPGSTDTRPKPRVAAMGGGGILPATISRRNEIPSVSRAVAAEAGGSSLLVEPGVDGQVGRAPVMAGAGPPVGDHGEHPLVLRHDLHHYDGGAT